ncbi:MAG: hypothetical protein BWK73_43990 [Thiothrix lacustris]|uniref:non-specific serine/threonine protein kinase n=1 Tax=Thiothrix lacustris TaxID=525917 RepID=A0A1Y1QBK0_9GAMM|nr:MAG: hypothetical protein BWK73_43990 [Thiothrix lacustris]
MKSLRFVLKRIKKCSHSRHAFNLVPQLNLSGLSLKEIPTQVFELKWLENLDISSTGISDFSTLANFPNLRVLHCNDNQINDFSTLVNLPNLRELYSDDNQISDFSTLANLPSLQVLHCNRNQISDFSALVNLPSLQVFQCNDNQTSDFSTLPNLSNLQVLYCDYNQISDFSVLANLPNLQVLHCDGHGYDNKISDFGTLPNLPNLQTLYCEDNQIRDISILANLPNLQALHCNYNQIRDISVLANLPNLQVLHCNYNQIRDISVLANLPNLQVLHCISNQISDLSPLYDSVMSGQIRTLYVNDNSVYGIPSIILWNDLLEDCIEDLRNYWQDLTKGSEKQQQLKIQLVGNGRVGKTTLAYALEHKRAPSEPFKSTHGIVIKEIQQALDGEDEPVTLQLWDFGGQEIYHATHRLFLSDDCLYLLLWAEETEEHPDETRHPVSYWLELIHDLGKNSPVILVKNQIDRSDRLPTRPPELTDDMPGASQIQQEVKISAMQYRGMPTLRGAIESVLEELKHQVCLELPTSWLQVQRELKQLDQKTIPFSHFKQLCIKAGINHAEWFVDYLHKTGVLFYRKGAFQDQIILDHWVIEAAYRVFDPKGHRGLVEQMRGSFKGAYTQIFWPDANETERNIYLDFMRNCGICYEPNHRYDTPFADRTFIIPALLPEDSFSRSAWHKSDKDWQLDIEYPFLHRSIIERIILRLGSTYQGEPWRTGIFCDTEYGQVLLECEYRDKQQSTQGTQFPFTWQPACPLGIRLTQTGERNQPTPPLSGIPATRTSQPRSIA